LTARSQANQGFNYVNEYVQQMQLGVLNFAATWPYFDPAKYPPPVTVTIPQLVYYTITGSLGQPCGDYTLPPPPSSAITGINVYWVQDLCDAYNLVEGTQVSCGGSEQPYSGILINNAPPQPTQNCDPNNDDFCYFQQPVTVDPGNPIVGVSGVYTLAGGTYSLDFAFQDGTSTGSIPSPNQQPYPVPFSISPPPGYALASIWAPSNDAYYGSASDMVFGFRYAPQTVGLAAPAGFAQRGATGD
jgi:hypothetical protein